jgi:glutathione peroxidase
MKLIFPGVLLLALIVSLPIAQHHYSRINIHNFVANDMHGEEVKFSEFDGTVLLIVNTATECGLTEQFIGLQDLYKTYRSKGFEIIAFPSDSFKQEPRSTRDVVSFCNDHFLVEFPIFEKIDIRGQYQASIYAYFAEETDPDFQGPVKWNFEKFLVDKDGDVIGRFDPEIEPGDPVLVKAIEDALTGS